MNRFKIAGTVTGRAPLAKSNIQELNDDHIYRPNRRARGLVRVYKFRLRIRPRVDPHWPDCPRCGQSATSCYNGKFGCIRCSWVQSAVPEVLSP